MIINKMVFVNNCVGRCHGLNQGIMFKAFSDFTTHMLTNTQELNIHRAEVAIREHPLVTFFIMFFKKVPSSMFTLHLYKCIK